MGSYRTVVAMLVAAAALWLAVFLTRSPPPPRADVQVPLSEIRAADIRAIELQSGEQTVRVESKGIEFASEQGAADPNVMAPLTTTLEFSYSRRFRPGDGDSSELGLATSGRTMVVETSSGERVRFVRGADVADGTLVWIGREDDALLITATEAGLLFPELDSVIDRRLFRLGDQAITEVVFKRLSGEAFFLRGTPLAYWVGRSPARLDLGQVAAMISPLRDLRVTARPEAEDGGGSYLALAAGSDKAWLQVAGVCDEGHALVRSSIGSGCVASDVFDAINPLVDDISPVLARLIDPNRELTAASLAKQGRVVEIDLDGEGVAAGREWLQLLGRATERAPQPTSEAVAAITLRYNRGEPDTIDVHRDGGAFVARVEGQPLAWRLSAEDGERIVGVESFHFRRRDLSSRDPSEIRAVRVGARSLDISSLEQRAKATLSHLEAARFVAAAAESVHRLLPARRAITVDFNPPPIATGDPDRVTIEIGAKASDGCYARIAGDAVVFILAADACAALLEL